MKIICCTLSNVNTIYDAQRFAEWLSDAFRRSTFKSWAEVSNAIGSTRSTLSRYAGAKVQLLTNKPSQPSADLCIKLAEAFGEDVNKVLQLGGHASENPLPANLIAEGFEGLDDDDLKKIVEFIKFTKSQKQK